VTKFHSSLKEFLVLTIYHVKLMPYKVGGKTYIGRYGGKEVWTGPSVPCDSGEITNPNSLTSSDEGV
jgi:hypothetical protein